MSQSTRDWYTLHIQTATYDPQAHTIISEQYDPLRHTLRLTAARTLHALPNATFSVVHLDTPPGYKITLAVTAALTTGQIQCVFQALGDLARTLHIGFTLAQELYGFHSGYSFHPDGSYTPLESYHLQEVPSPWAWPDTGVLVAARSGN